MASALEHTLTWLVQTVLVAGVVVMLGGALGVEYLFVEFGNETESLGRIVLSLLLAAGSVFFLLHHTSQMIDEKLESATETETETGDGGSPN